ncbi:secreted RxLR effector protein 161-like [Salvia splendens]|uniref:secreted RxLR effector protein 161-like n=1 Tax=Salvia splendens TaxID=180675 RepID=UPI001C2647FF|nr:secreted RxLR effector protein 161-like [Salvia splendens]
MADHGRQHWLSLKWTLRYLRGAGDYGILFRGGEEYVGDPLVGYCDSDYAGNIDNRRSQSGYVFTLYGGAVCWKSSLQSVVAQSTTEAEYMAMTVAVRENFWLRGIASDFGVEQKSIAIGTVIPNHRFQLCNTSLFVLVELGHDNCVLGNHTLQDGISHAVKTNNCS